MQRLLTLLLHETPSCEKQRIVGRWAQLASMGHDRVIAAACLGMGVA